MNWHKIRKKWNKFGTTVLFVFPKVQTQSTGYIIPHCHSCVLIQDLSLLETCYIACLLFFNQTKGSFQFNYTLNSSACRARGSRYHWCTSPPFIMPLGSPTDPEAWCISLSLSLIISPSMLMTQRLMPGQNWAPIFRAPPCLQFYTVYKYLWTHTDS